MTEAKRFTTETPADTSPTPFTVGGVGVLSGEPWEEEFHLVPVIPSAALDDLSASVTVDRRGRQVYNSVSVLRFFDSALVDDDVERFRDMCASKDRAVDLAKLGEIMEWAAEAGTQVPTQRPSGSINGAVPAASTSTGA